MQVKNKSFLRINTKFLLSSIFVFIAFGCHKDNQFDLSYDCYSKSSYFNSFGVKQGWTNWYYRDNLIIFAENSEGNSSKLTYDNQGNLIKDESTNKDHSSTTEIYEYNANNKRVKETYLPEGQYIVTVYKDTLKVMSYSNNSYDGPPDTIHYYYNEANKLDSVVYKDSKAILYYSPEIDSTLIFDHKNQLTGRRYFKYKDGRKIYERSFYYIAEINSFMDYKYSWEYNEKLLLTRYCYSFIDNSSLISWNDIRNSYNESDLLTKSEYYDKDNKLLGYFIEIYNNSVPIKSEYYDSMGVLTGYSIYENTCKK